jgi:hypothetical protein
MQPEPPAIRVRQVIDEMTVPGERSTRSIRRPSTEEPAPARPLAEQRSQSRETGVGGAKHSFGCTRSVPLGYPVARSGDPAARGQ